MINNIKTVLILVASLWSPIIFGQLKLGTYKIISDTPNSFEGRLFSELVINSDRTFTYRYRTSVSCFLWYDSDGKWEISKDTLILTDTMISFHPVVNFTRHKETNDSRIAILVKTKQNAPIEGIRILTIFKNSRDTLAGYTNADGKVIISTKGRTANKKDGKLLSIDDVEIFVCHFSKDQDQSTNNFSGLSSEMECVIDDDAKDEAVIRITTYKIDGPNLFYLNQWYNKENVRPGRYLSGSFKFDRE